ncbi:MAG: ABC transporter ATP-binding protein [Eubacteriales bacterium]|nr:ABC transporter ATP-binding protein [Eubacteriales bacterium]MCI6123018.1 ABC transporter ATP-binding protein [Christensenellaceae bacterium]MCI6669598.1 ABC transporter ATP-binding protein [Christensenellaceae bacterium]MCI6942048.1 ABC transporter ATP-binding protein [Christensenellaceae bacterium]MDY4695284.1 ABC transporter ATP-binding protein [Eubacteriales bacterium]
MARKLLSVRDLKTSFFTHVGEVKAVRGISFDVNEGEVLGIVGESGSGKSVTSLSIMGLLQYPGRVVDGEILLNGEDILTYSKDQMRKVRGKEIAMIFQDPMTSLNPVYTIGNQVMEMILEHEKMTKREARARAIEMLKLVGIPAAEKRIDSYPHEFSGGMRQRVMIALALSCNPKLLIADEPTTALDVTIQAQILNLIKKLNRQFGMTTMLITHDLGVVATVCDKVAVMYGGLIMEYGTVDEIFYHPRHPYTMGLLGSIPHVDGGEKRRLIPIDGTPPDLINPPKGCPFSTRCKYCMNVCTQEQPPYFAEDKHRTMCWMLDVDAPKDSDYEMRKAGVNYGR